MVQSHFRMRAGVAAAFVVGAFLTASCENADTPAGGSGNEAPDAKFARDYKRSTVAALEAQAGPTCGGTDAHDRHGGFPTSCATCHPCGGQFAVVQMTLPRGTSTEGSTITPGDPTTCTVACHYPFGGTPKSIAWNAPGPLNCTSCHFSVGSGTSFRSAHALADPSPTVERSGCEACHTLSAHLSGTVRIATGEGTSIDLLPNAPANVDVACKNCHDGAGNPLAGRTPPVLVGYESSTGDFHGSRAGTGWGGTLVGYQRGAAALPCSACHDTHASANSFMFAANVNGGAVAPGVINRAGVGAEALCSKCHAGERHAGCMKSGCHTVDKQPAGSACFVCHGHEGIVNFVWPTTHSESNWEVPGCTHCHGSVAMGGAGWGPVVEYTPPAIANNLVSVTNVTGNAATITWSTHEKATSYVEYGVGTPSRTAGNNTMTLQHSVTLTGLSEDTTYTFRVRTSDAMRNVTLTPLSALTTASLQAPPAPTLIDVPYVVQCDPTGSVQLRWNAVADPQGDPVQYRVVLDDSASFDSPRADSGWIAATSYATIVDLTDPPTYYYWRVQARDATHGSTSPWSTVDQFYGMQDDPAYCW